MGVSPSCWYSANRRYVAMPNSNASTPKKAGGWEAQISPMQLSSIGINAAIAKYTTHMARTKSATILTMADGVRCTAR
ncbi:MAG: hypothetical protein QXR64_06765 [Pyrobaculum sp.]